jgi:hypothetical protein
MVEGQEFKHNNKSVMLLELISNFSLCSAQKNFHAQYSRRFRFRVLLFDLSVVLCQEIDQV